VALALGVLAARAAVRTLPGVPFTSAREADAGTDLGGLFALALGLGGLGFAFGGWLPPALRWPVALAAIAVAALALRRQPDGGAVGVGAWDGDEPGDDARTGAGGDGGSTPSGAAALASAGREAAADAAVDAAADVPLPTPAEGLRRELRAIAALYAVTSLLPLALGALFAP
ncbi:MAG: hypothetical protein ACK595_10505, partial [Planctomycetota bacterium]